MDDIDQAISLVTATQNALDAVSSIAKQMKGLVAASSVPGSMDTNQFDDLLKQLNNVVGDAYYQGTNLIANRSAAGDAVTTATHKVEFSELSSSKLEIRGQFAGSSYYLNTGGDAKLIPDSSGDSVSATGTNGILDAEGSGDVQVNTTTTGDQGNLSQFGTSVAGLSGGGHVVAFRDNSTGTATIKFQLYNSSGSPAGSETAVPAGAGRQDYPEVASLANGGYVLTWIDFGADQDIKAQVYDANGSTVGGVISVNNETTGNQKEPVVTGLSGGGFVIAWAGENTSDNDEISARVFNDSGTAQGVQFNVNTPTAANVENYTTITSLSNGGFMVNWTEDSGLDGSGTSIMGRRYDSTGSATTNQFVVNGSTVNSEVSPQATELSDGTYVVAWIDSGGRDGAGFGVYARHLNADGSVIKDDFLVNASTAGNQYWPYIGATADGGYVITWTDDTKEGNSGVYAQRFDSSSNTVGAEFQVSSTTSGNQQAARFASVNNGQGFVIAWEDSALDGSGYGVFARKFSLGLTGGTLSGSNVTATDYANNKVTVTIGGVPQNVNIVKQGLGIANAWYYQDFNTVAGRTEALNDLNNAVDTVRSLSSRLGSDISLLQVRADFTNKYSQDLKAGADKLVLADINEEGANLLAIQTRSQLGMQALSFLGQAVQSILKIFR